MLPKQPRIPVDIAAASPRRPVGESSSDSQRARNLQGAEPEDRTHTYSPEAIDKLLHGEQPTVRPPKNAADDVTRVGEIPIEERMAAQAMSSNKGVGHEDVTRVYDASTNQPKSEVTAPGARKSALDLQAEPLVVIRPEPPKARWGRWVILGLVVAVVAGGWTYRAPIGKQVGRVQDSFVRGIAAGKAGNARMPSTATPLVSVSISVSPADARILLDGVAVTNPYSVQQPPDKQSHSLVAEAPGYLPLRRNVQFERDLTVVLALAQDLQAAVATPPDRLAAAPTPAIAEPAPAAPAPKASRVMRRRTKAVATDAPAAETPSNANCSTPYTVDAEGIKTYKPECL